MASETHGDFSSEEDVSDTDVTTGESYSLSDQQLQQSRIEAFYLSSCRARGTSPSQRALAALDQATNAKIRRTNKHIAANAAQMKANAKKWNIEFQN